DPLMRLALEQAARREENKRRKREEALTRLHQAQERVRVERIRREAAKTARAILQNQRATQDHAAPAPARPPRSLPPVPVALEAPALNAQDTLFPLTDLRDYFLRERAARWWVSNQSDDLLCLPYCRMERLEYQLRSALRVLGPLRGRALLSDEVGLGKTIEAGLVLKEYLTRGMVKRALILTVPSLVDQWEEELSDKFNL